MVVWKKIEGFGYEVCNLGLVREFGISQQRVCDIFKGRYG